VSAQREAVREVETQAAEVRRLTATLRLQTLRAEVKAAQALRLLAEERKRTRPATANDNKNKVDGGDADTHSGSRHDPADTPTEAAGEQRTPTKDEASNDDPEPPCFHQHAAWGTELVNASTPVAKYTVTDNGEGIHYHTLYTIPPEQEADALEKLRRIAPENRLNTKNTPRGLCVKILPHGKETGNEYEGEGSNHTATTRAAEATPPTEHNGPRGKRTDTPHRHHRHAKPTPTPQVVGDNHVDKATHRGGKRTRGGRREGASKQQLPRGGDDEQPPLTRNRASTT